MKDDLPLKPGVVTVDAAVERVRAGALTAHSERVDLHKAMGRVLFAPVVAGRDQPPFDASAMDGYAVRGEDLADKTAPVVLRVIGESGAGQAFDGMVGVGEAVRIFTGAPMPQGCDAVVVQEYTDAGDGVVAVRAEGMALRKANLRAAGQDFRNGDMLLKAGIRLDPWRLSLAAAAGCAELTVARRPKVAVLCTGDELVLPGETPRADQIYESASAAIMALVKQWGGKPSYLGVGKDKEKALLKALKATDADLIVTVGGASVGDHDLVKPALGKLGLELDFDGVKVRPGKPTSFGVLADGRKVLGLPGNPASAFVMAQLLLKAWIEASLGVEARQGYVKAVALAAIPPNGPREAYLRGALTMSEHGRMQVTPFADQDSSLIQVFAQADGLIRVPAGAEAVAVGGLVEVLPLDRL
ncbi:MAG: molybdopterin molybdotransferase MoeA [Asticcacaulis sp.]|nr:molybdopterin molybdotransferase MoeA [Asticcacaulis sp.]